MAVLPLFNRVASPSPIVPSRPWARTLVALSLCASLAQAEPLQNPTTWITVGADAFEMLQNAPELSLDGEPLRLHQEIGQVVMTEVKTSDIPKVSELIHHYFNRCSGFLAHSDRARAADTLRRVVEEKGGGTIDYILDQQGFVNAAQQDLEAERIRETIERLSTDYNNRFYSHPSGRTASEWIRDLWQGYAAGRDDVTVELVEHSWNQPSVRLTIEGAYYPDQIVVLGGHLDSIAPGSSNPNFSAPGADDNASGIATLSEVIRVIMERNFRPSRTVQFMGYAAEEVGLLGSQEIADSYAAQGIEMVGALQLDMTAFNGSVEDVGLLSDFTNSTLTAFVGTLIDTYQPDLVRVSTACGYGCSDHASWHRAGYPAAMAFEARVGQHNSAIHSTGDTLATLNNSAEHALKFARLGLAFMVEVSTDDLGELFIDGFESGDLSAWTSTN